jgi:hypothetical protein
MLDTHADPHIIKSSYAPLGDIPERFIHYAMNTPSMQQPQDYLTQELPDLIKHYQYKLQSWPFFVDTDCFNKIAQPATQLPLLISKVPELFFNNDIDALCEYFHIENKLLFSMLFNHKWRGQSLIARGDFINSKDGLMCLEQNIGSQIGGWQPELISEAYLKTPGLSTFMQDNKVRYTPANVLKTWFDYVIRLNLQHTKLVDNGIHNMFITATEEYRGSGMKSYFESIYRQTLATHGLTGLLILDTYENVVVTPAGVSYAGQKIHSVVNPLGQQIPSALLRAYMACKVYIADETISAVLSDKRVLALLSCNVNNDALFSPKEQQIISDHLPWTRAFDQTHVNYKGQQQTLKTLAITQQHEFVLKHAKGRQGKDLYIGGKTPPGEWQEAVERAFEEQTWVLQQHYHSLPYLGQMGDSGYGTYDAIWGTFCFGDELAKIWMRLQPTDNTTGIINSHQGAQETMVYIVDPAPSDEAHSQSGSNHSSSGDFHVR